MSEPEFERVLFVLGGDFKSSALFFCGGEGSSLGLHDNAKAVRIVCGFLVFLDHEEIFEAFNGGTDFDSDSEGGFLFSEIVVGCAMLAMGARGQ